MSVKISPPLIKNVDVNLELELYKLQIPDKENPSLSVLKSKITKIGYYTNRCVDYLNRNGFLLIPNMKEDPIHQDAFLSMVKYLELFSSFRGIFLNILTQIKTESQNIKIEFKEKNETNLNEIKGMSKILKILQLFVPAKISENIPAETNFKEVLNKERITLKKIDLNNEDSSYICNKIIKINKIAEYALNEFLNSNSEQKTEWLELFTDASELSLLASQKMNEFLIGLATQLKQQNSDPEEKEIDTIQRIARLFQTYFVQN